MADSYFIRALPAITSAASFAAYSVAILTIGDASFAAALHDNK